MNNKKLKLTFKQLYNNYHIPQYLMADAIGLHSKTVNGYVRINRQLTEGQALAIFRAVKRKYRAAECVIQRALNEFRKNDEDN